MDTTKKIDDLLQEAHEFDRQGRFEAEQLCRTALRMDSKYSQAYACLGALAFHRGKLLDSEEYLKKSVQVNPKAGGYTELGALYVQMGRYDEAEEQLNQAMQLSRTDSQARLELGSLYLLTDRENKVVCLLREALAIDPLSKEPPRALADADPSRPGLCGLPAALVGQAQDPRP